MVDETNSRKEGQPNVPANAELTKSIEKDGELEELERPSHKLKGGRGPLWVLIILAVVIVGSYLSWPMVSGLILEKLQAEAPRTMAAIKELDRRMAQLEAANKHYKTAIDSIKDAQAEISKHLVDLAKTVPGTDILANLGRKLEAIEETIANLDQRTGGDAFDMLAQEMERLKSRYTELADRPDQIDNADITEKTAALAAANSRLHQTTAALQARLELLESSVQQDALSREKTGLGKSLVVAVGQLRQTVLSGRPYVEPLATVAALAKKNEKFTAAILTLTRTAKKGVATQRVLSDQFPSVARTVMKADKKDGDGFFQRTWQRVGSLITIRRVGEVDGEETDAILARTERRLVAGELAATIELMESLRGPASVAAQAWLDRAKTRLRAEHALADLQSQVITGLADG